ncbi:MAG TPA: bacteriohemerythrin [Nitrospirota bacterium]|nr:bacteriohemerythrin [Nitrospirota bacterium]
MALITWSNDLSVNIKEFDEEHKKLISMVNDLHSAMGSGKGKEVMGPILVRLVDYTKTHFAAEEQLMRKHEYPGYVSHKSLHDDLTKQVMDLQNKFQEGRMLVTVQVMNFLKDWLSNHIQNTDKKYGPYLNGKGIA